MRLCTSAREVKPASYPPHSLPQPGGCSPPSPPLCNGKRCPCTRLCSSHGSPAKKKEQTDLTSPPQKLPSRQSRCETVEWHTAGLMTSSDAWAVEGKAEKGRWRAGKGGRGQQGDVDGAEGESEGGEGMRKTGRVAHVEQCRVTDLALAVPPSCRAELHELSHRPLPCELFMLRGGEVRSLASTELS